MYSIAVAGEISFGALNYTVLVIYLAAMITVGLACAGGQKGTEDYFLAGRRMPWLAVTLSLFATVISAISFIGIPGLVFAENISFLAGICMLPIISPLVILWFFPFYRKLKVTTTYEYIFHRFGAKARYVVSALFLLGRLGWLGTVIFAPALALSTVTGISLWTSILIIGGVGTFYTVTGGMAAVIWTDVVQALILVGGAIWITASLVLNVPGGIQGIFEIASEAGKLDFGTFRFSFVEMTLGMVAVSYFLNFLHDYGADQMSVQRLLTTSDLRSMARATLLNAFITLAFMTLLAFIGLALYSWNEADPTRLPAGVSGDRILPYYVLHALPAGISGLIITGVFAAAMSSLDSGINSLSTVVICDFLRPLRRVAASEIKDLRVAKVLTIGFGFLATGVAFYASTLDQILRAAQFFLGLFTGPVLAIFMLGLMTKRANFKGWLVGLATAIPCSIWVQQYTALHFIYYFPLSFLISAIAGYFASLIFKDSDANPDYCMGGQASKTSVDLQDVVVPVAGERES